MPFSIARDDAPATELTTSPNHVYFIVRVLPNPSSGGGAIAIRRVPKACGPVETVVASDIDASFGRPRSFAVANDHVYWTTDRGVRRAPLTAGNVDTFTARTGKFQIADSSLLLNVESDAGWNVRALPLAGGDIPFLNDAAMAVADDASLYFDKFAPGTQREVSFGSTPRDAGAYKALIACSAATTGCPVNLVSDGTFLYYTLPFGDPRLFRMPVGGGSSQPVSTAPWMWTTFGADKRWVYAYDTTTLVRGSKSDGHVEVIARVPTDEILRAAVFDEGTIYWIANKLASAGGCRVLKLRPAL
jgi:hypothetical protein